MTATALEGHAGKVGAARRWMIVALALRELRGGLRGFYVFVACVALGVAVITGVGALSDALRAGFEKQGETLLGGDATLARPHRRAEPAERAWLEARGRVSETATLRAMARRLDATEQSLIELKGVDNAYPLVGAVRLDRSAETSLPRLLANGGAAVDPILLATLGLAVGDRMQLGKTEVEIRAVIGAEPDRISDRLTFGPRVFIDLASLEASALAEPGSLVRWRYALKLVGSSAPSDLLALRQQVARDLPDAGFTVADRRDPSPQVSRTLERLRQFLTLIGLTSLLVGGVGVANAVATYIDRRRRVIATFKSLGASNRQIFTLHIVQVITISTLGIGIGLGVGLLFPFVLTPLIGDALPVQTAFQISAASIAIAVGYGLLVSLLFTVWPLARAGAIRPAVLFRDEVAPGRERPPAFAIAATVAIAVGLLGLALATSESKPIAFYFCASLAGIFILFFGLGHAITLLARRAPRPHQPELRLALSSLGSPGGLTRSVVLSLGSGLSLLVAVALADASIVDELESRLPRNSPDFFVLDIPRTEIDGIVSLVQRTVPQAHINQAPMLRGRLVKLGQRSVEQIRTTPDVQWVLSGDRGLTYGNEVPEGSKVVAGSWWSADYAGEPLVSFEADIAKKLALQIGDRITVNVLGRNIEARIANLREVRWESLAINFVMVFSPNTLRNAPHNLLATIALPKQTPLAQEAELARQIGRAYPAVTAIRVRDAINAFNTVFQRIMVAVRAAGSITLIAGALVLAGALATAQRRRIQQAVIVKVLGGTRRRILTAHAAEYLLLAAATAAVAVVVGGIAAWSTVTWVIDVPFVFSLSAIGFALGTACGLVLLLGGIGTWRVLQARPVPYLRSE
jgi:putative ABC transport system permease protein